MADNKKQAQITVPGIDANIELPVLSGTVGPDVIDISGLTKNGMFTYDPGFVSTASCDSAITFIDGGNGVLLHGGYPIEQLAEQSDYLELCYLLLNGELPNATQRDAFNDSITHHTMVNEQLAQFFRGFRRDAHPMAIMCGVVGALSAFYHDALDIEDDNQRVITAHRLIAKMPTLAAMCYKYSQGLSLIHI